MTNFAAGFVIGVVGRFFLYTTYYSVLFAGFIIAVVFIASKQNKAVFQKNIIFALSICIGFHHLDSAVGASKDLVWPNSFYISPVNVTAKVHSFKNNVLILDRISSGDTTVRGKAKVFVGPKVTMPKYINSIKAIIKFKRPQYFANEGVFDLKKLYWLQGVVAEGNILNVVTFEHDSSVRSNLKQKLMNAYSGTNIGIALALFFGEKELIPKDIVDNYVKSGTIHLISISGLHVGLVFMIVKSLFFYKQRCLSLWSKRKFFSNFVKAYHGSFIALFVSLFYSYLAGFGYPCQRALISLTIITLSDILGFGYNSQRVWVIALFLVLLLQPLAVYSYSLWLSFLIVAVILHLNNIGSYGNKLWNLLRFQFFMFMSALPVSVTGLPISYPISSLSNIVLVPVYSLLIVPTLFVGIVFTNFNESLSKFVFMIVDILISSCNELAAFMVRVGSWSELSQRNFSSIEVATISLCCIVILMPYKFPGKYLAFIFLVLIFNVRPGSGLEDGEAVVDFIDVGQGNATLVSTKSFTLLYDTGFSKGKFSIGDKVLAPLLKHKGINTLDSVVISHFENDHVGGFKALSKQVSVSHVYAPYRNEMIKGVPFSRCRDGLDFTVDGVKFEFLYPAPEIFQYKVSKNNTSCVLKVSSNTGSVLLAGDIESQAENFLVSVYGQKLKSSILLAPHHGSKTSSSIKFVDTVNPEFLVISAGRNNAYGHPHKDVVGRYAKKFVKILSTLDHGQTSIKLTNKDGAKVIRYHRDLKKRPWYS